MVGIQEIESDSAFDSKIGTLSSDHIAVIFFHAPWATPCARVKDILETLAESYNPNESSNVTFFGVNADDLAEVCDKYDVSAVPYIIIERNHKVLETVSGSDGNQIRAALEKHASTSSKPAFQLPPQQTAAPPAEKSRDLSAYAPKKSDPQTAPQYSSSTMEGRSKDDLFKRLGELVKAAPVMLFMKGVPSAPQCGFSRTLINLLRERGVRYGFFNILADEDVRQGLKEFADWPTFPQLWMDGELVGGLDIIKEELASDPDFFAKYSSPPGAGGPAHPPAAVSAAA